jgi:hypothetical protein
LIPFTFHWYDGFEPPFVVVAVKFTVVPVQTGFAEGETATVTGTVGMTVIGMLFDVAWLLDMHDAMDDVSWHEMISPFTGV